MEDDTELLDWGHEEEDSTAMHGSGQRTFSVDDAEDAVSLGGDEEDEFLTYQSRVPQDTAHRAYSPPKSRQTRQEPLRGHNDSPRPHHSQDFSNERTGLGDQSSLPGRMHPLGTLVHALPPKPVLSSVPFVHPSHPSIIEATAMASRADREKRNGTGSKTSVYDHNDSLPPGWEVKHPRSGRGVYYYNIHTQESTWTRPTAPTIREKHGERSDRRDDLDKPTSTRNENIISRVGRAESGDMSYGDRHYRPGEPGWREERPAPSTQLIDSYIPDSHSPNHRNSRPSPPPSRAREREPTPPPRRPVSSAGSFGDRDGIQSSHREASSLAPLSAEDRIWVARDSVPHEHPREHRQREDPTLLEAERRNLPRDTERPSTLRPKSPASYTRRPQESANVAPYSSSKTAQPLSGAPPERKSRFSQADSLTQYGHRQLEFRDAGMRRAHTDDIPSHGARYADDVPSSRPISDVHGNDIAPTHPASDAQRSGSWKRTALPPQDEAFRPAPRPAPTQRGGHYPGPTSSAPAPVPLNRYTSRVTPDNVLRDLVRRSPSPPDLPTERDDRDRGRLRWSKPYANGPSQMDSRTTHESSRSRTHDTAMDVDEAPLLRSSDPPAKQIPPRRSGLQDDVPRYPRAMLNSDNDGLPRGVREARDGTDFRHRFAVDDSFRFGSSRDRQGTERHFTDQAISQKEPIRGAEAKPPPPGSNIKLSGTNNIPIGAKHKFASNVPFAPVSPSSTHRAPAVTSGGSDELVVVRRDRVNRDHERTPYLGGATGDRSGLMESTRREDIRRSPPNNPSALPHTEPLPPPVRPSRAALGISRFGPPLMKENTETVRTLTSVSSDILPPEKVTESSAHATPPPPSRESSMTSLNDIAAPSVRPSHLPLRPASPRGYRHRLGDVKPYYHPGTRSPGGRDPSGSDVNAEVAAHPRPPSPSRKHAADAYLSGPPAPPLAARDDRDTQNSERPRANFRDFGAEHHAARSRPPLAMQDETRDHGLPAMHPERALMLQTNGLPPRPPSALGRTRSVKGLKRDRRDEHDHDRAEPLRGASGGHYRSASPPGSERRRYPEGDRSTGYVGGSGVGGGGGGASLLDRLSMDDGSRINSPSLRDRVQLPSKRDREEMLVGDFSLDPEGDDYDASKRVRKRGGPKMRRGRM